MVADEQMALSRLPLLSESQTHAIVAKLLTRPTRSSNKVSACTSCSKRRCARMARPSRWCSATNA
ncbi:hypothetical protein LP420_13300 [Massilia sp. B-10]|nr:hypothetical protein LP420_13300 [Massilia sp. B-10]